MTGWGGVAGDGKGDDERHVEREDDEHHQNDGQWGAADVILDEREADHPGRDDVGQQGPPEDEKEPVPVKRPQPGRQVAADEQQCRADHGDRDRHAERRAARGVRRHQDSADDDEAKGNGGQPGDRREPPGQCRLRRDGGNAAHWVATLVMMMSVATCITPVMPAVTTNRRISLAITAPSGLGLRISNRTAMLAGSSTPSAITAITPTTQNDATSQPWFGLAGDRLPSLSANWNPAASVISTSVGISRTIFGMNRAVNSARAATDNRPRIGPTMSPTNRSIAVHRPPPTTWQNVSAHSQLPAMEAMTNATTAATIGRPFSGTTWIVGRAATCAVPTAPTCMFPTSVMGVPSRPGGARVTVPAAAPPGTSRSWRASGERPGYGAERRWLSRKRSSSMAAGSRGPAGWPHSRAGACSTAHSLVPARRAARGLLVAAAGTVGFPGIARVAAIGTSRLTRSPLVAT